MKITEEWQEAAQRLANGEVGVIPTDTLYGIVGSALKPAVVERIYTLRQRESHKPLIILLSEAEDLARFNIDTSGAVNELLGKVWPGPVSIILPVAAAELVYLHRGSGGIAFRVPAKLALRELLRQVGPLVAPSANLAGEPSAQTVDEARAYFGEEVFYVDEGRLVNPPSALVSLLSGVPQVLRPAPGLNLGKLSI